MSDSQLRPADFNCEILPCEVPYNFEDTSQFQKLSFPEEACVRLNSLLQLAPTVAAADALSKTYVLRFPEGVQGVLMRLKQGGMYGLEMECLRCNTTKKWEDHYLTDAQLLIEDNIKKRFLQNQ